MRKLKITVKNSCTPSRCSLGFSGSLMSSGRSRWAQELPSLAPMSRLRWACRAGQWKRMCSPSWVWWRQTGHPGSSALLSLCSHCRIGPRLVLIHVYAESAYLFQCMRLPSPVVGWDLCSTLVSLDRCLMPAAVAVYFSLSSCPTRLRWPAAASASSFPVTPMCDLTQAMPVSKLASPLATKSDLMARSMPERGA